MHVRKKIKAVPKKLKSCFDRSLARIGSCANPIKTNRNTAPRESLISISKEFISHRISNGCRCTCYGSRVNKISRMHEYGCIAVYQSSFAENVSPSLAG